MKTISKTIFAVYLLGLLWLVLFKFSIDFSSVLLDHQARGLNLIPFADSLRSEIISNFVVFIPFGLLLAVNFKQISVLRKITFIFLFSITVEIVQFIVAIGVTDITDVIMNTLGGLLGLMTYGFSNRYIDSEKLDRFIVLVGVILFVLLVIARFFVFKVRY